MIAAAVIFAIVAALVIMVIATSSRLIGLRRSVNRAFANIDAQLKQRQDLASDLIEAVKGNAADEQLDELAAACAAAEAAPAVEERVDAENALTGALGGLMAASETNPDLKANPAFLRLKGELADLENKIAGACRPFNDAVAILNARIQTFPALLFAAALGFAPRDLLDLGDDRAANAR